MKNSPILNVLIVFFGICMLTPYTTRAEIDESAESAFGVEQGETISNGFVFLDGKYVGTPYVVTRRGAAIYINDAKVATPVRWPPVDYRDEKPEFADNLTVRSRFDDLLIANSPGDSWDRRMVRWLRRHHESAEARQLILNYYRSLPFVDHAELKGNVLTVSTKSGEEREIDIGGPVYTPPTKEEMLEELKRVKTRFESRLNKGDCFFLFAEGGEISFGLSKARKDLPGIVSVLESSIPKDKKLDSLKLFGLLPREHPKKWERIATGFQASAELNERIKALRGKRAAGTDKEKRLLEEEQAIRKKNDAPGRSESGHHWFLWAVVIALIAIALGASAIKLRAKRS